MANSSYEINQFKNLINEIKQFLSKQANLTDQDRKIISDLLQVLKYEVEFEILEQCMNDNNLLISIIADIDTKLIELEKRREEIINTPGENWSKNIRLISIGMSKTRLNNLKQCVSDKNFSYYIDAMNKSLTSTEALVAVCQEVLSCGLDEFNMMFGSKIADGTEIGVDAVNTMYLIMHNYQLREELELYRKRTQSIEVCDAGIEKNEKYLHYLEIAKENEELLRDYYDLKKSIMDSEANKILYKNNISKQTLQQQSIIGEIKELTSKIFKHGKQNTLAQSIAKNQAELEELLKKENRFIEIEGKLESVGLGPIIKVSNDIIDNSIEQSAAIVIRKAVLSDKVFDVEALKRNFLIQNSNLDEKRKRALASTENYKASMSFYARELVEEHFEDVKRVLSIIEGKQNGEFTPVIAALVLKALAVSKDFSYEEINEICDLNQGAEKLFISYENVVTRSLREVQDLLEELETRDEYDVSDFGPIKL